MHLSGGGIRALGESEIRIEALRKARCIVEHYIKTQEPDMREHVLDVWKQDGQQSVMAIEPKVGFNPMKSADFREKYLKGHKVGLIPEDAIETKRISFDLSDLRDVDYQDRYIDIECMRYGTHYIKHTGLLKDMRDSTLSYNKQLAAHVLSSSVLNSGKCINVIPYQRWYLSNSQLIPSLLTRFGCPPVMNPSKYLCTCTSKPTMAEQPLHAITGCRRPGLYHGLTRRHDAIRDSLVSHLRQNADTTKEPMFQSAANIQLPENQRQRADILVIDRSCTRHVLLDVAIVCPSTRTMVSTSHTDKIQGIAARKKYGEKIRKYKSHFRDDTREFIPFIIESGGYIHEKAIKFLESIFGTRSQTGLQKIHNTIVAIQNTLFANNARLFSKVNGALNISGST